MHWDNKEMDEPGFYRYAAETMLPLLSQLEQELSGVLVSDDIEYIHRARVASRRIRACFTNFSSCFPDKTIRKWNQDIRLITRSLGEARDIDVQIAFLQSYFSSHVHDVNNYKSLFYSETKQSTRNVIPALISKFSTDSNTDPHYNHEILLYLSSGNIGDDNRIEKNPDISYYPADILRPGLECILLRFIQRRQAIQPDVVKTVTILEKKRTTEVMKTFLHEIRTRAELEGSEMQSEFSYQQAFFHIMAALSDFLSYEPWLSDPLMISRHHEMRIAGKKLRYTLESFSGLFSCKLKNEIRTFKTLQDILGDMHDCDVWISSLPTILEEEEKYSVHYFGNDSFYSLLKPGFDELLTSRKKDREKLFKKLHDLWFSLKKDGFWDQLEEKITAPLHSSFSESEQLCDKSVTVALISDIHANLPALEAILADAKERGVTAIINAGDSIGYGAFPDEVVTLLRRQHILSVIGNYDRSVIQKKWKIKKFRSPDKQIAMRYAYKHLSKENRAYLKGLPKQIKFRTFGKKLLITHGSPDSITEYLVTETPESRYSEIAEKIDADIIVTGHSHLPSIRQVSGVWFVNCGSVGRTEDGDPRACYALLTMDPFSIVHIRIPYEIEKAIEAIHERHLPESFARIISEGKPLDVISKPEEDIL